MQPRLLALIALCWFALAARGATPTFSSFYTNHFLTNGFLIKAKLNPTQFDTNSSEISITITNIGTNVTVAGVHWTNDAGTLHPIVLTNQTMVPSLFIGTNSQTAYADPLTGESIVSIHAIDLGDINWNNVYIATTQNSADINQSTGFFDLNTYTNRAFENLGVVTNASGIWKIESGVDPDNATDAAKLYTEYAAAGQVVGAFQPAIADSSDAIAWRFGTVNPLDFGAIIGALNNGTNVAAVGAQGTISVGRNTANYFGGAIPNDGSSLLSVRYGDEFNYNQIYGEVTDSADENYYGWYNFVARTNEFAIKGHVYDGVSDYNFQAVAAPANNDSPSISLTKDNVGMTLNPAVTDGISAVAYAFSTVNTLTSGRIAAFQHNQTNVTVFWPHGGIEVGPNTEAWYGNPLNSGEALVSYNNPDLGDPASANAIIARLEQNDGAASHFQIAQDFTQSNVQFYQQAAGSSASGVFQYASPTEGWLEVQVLGGTMGTLRPARTGSAPYVFDTPTYLNSTVPVFAVRNFTTNLVSVGPAAQINFGIGDTNVLYRSGNNLVYTNGGSTVDYTVVNGAGKRAILEANSDASARLYAPDGYAEVRNASQGVRLNGAYWEPSTSGAVNFGGPVGNWINELGFISGYVKGFQSGSTNAYLSFTHSGTNGLALYNSVATGSAGNPRAHAFGFNGTNTVLLPLSLTEPSVTVSNVAGNAALFGLNAGGQALVSVAGTATAVTLYDGTVAATLFGSTFSPSPMATLGTSANPWDSLTVSNRVYFMNGGSAGPSISSGSGSPEGAVTAAVGSLWLRNDGGALTTLWVKESGAGNTGWAAK